MRLLTRVSVACASLCLPVLAFAAAPDGVTGIKATLQSGKVLVTWTPLADDMKIANYRVYYSHASILSNNGLYDDYDTVDGSVNSFTIVNTPQSDTVYVSVLAVNEAGEESPYFAEEAHLKLSGAAASSSSVSIAAPSSAMSVQTVSSAMTTQADDATVHLLSVKALSATGVELAFSQAVTVDRSIAINAFEIRSGSGKKLTLTRLTIIGNTVRIDTVPQERGTVYAIILGQGITGLSADAMRQIPLDSAQGPMLFSGHMSGIKPVVESSSSSTVSSAAPSSTGNTSTTDITSLTLRAAPEKKGLFTVEAAWTISGDRAIRELQISQTTDRGRTFGAPKSVPAATAGMRVPHVPAGSFGLLIRVVYADGTVSKGILKTVDLGSVPVSPIGGNVIGKPTSGKLPSSGPGLLLVLLATGSALGYTTMKRMQTAKA